MKTALYVVMFLGACATTPVLKHSPTEPFWCFSISGELRPADPASVCERTLQECKATRELTFKVGYKASACSGEDEAVCLRVRLPDEPIRTLCFRDGLDCTKVEENGVPKNARVYSCAVESAD